MIDVVVIFIILLIVALIFKRFDNVIIFFGLIDIILRILDYIGKHTIQEIKNIIDKFLPNSIPAIISANSTGILETILMWVYVILMILFTFYVLKMLIHRL